MANQEKETGGNELQFTSSEELLRYTAQKFNELDAEGEKALFDNEDVEGFRNALNLRTQLIIDLPENVEKIVQQTGTVFPEEELHLLYDYSEHAKKMLESGNIFGMGVLLTWKGSKIDDPNDLERMIGRLYPPQPQK